MSAVGWVILVMLTGVPYLVGYIHGHCKGYNQFWKDVEDGEIDIGSD